MNARNISWLVLVVTVIATVPLSAKFHGATFLFIFEGLGGAVLHAIFESDVEVTVPETDSTASAEVKDLARAA